MYQIGYRAKAYYRSGNLLFAKMVAKNHYSTEEEAMEHAESEFPSDLSEYGIETKTKRQIVIECHKYIIETCPEGYCVCPRCMGTGVYNGASNWTRNGVKECFRCEGLGILKLKGE